MLPYPLTIFETLKFYQNKPKLNGVYLRHNVPEIKDREYVINLGQYESIGVEHIPKEMKNFIGNKNIRTNIFRLEEYNSTRSRYLCIGFVDFMLNGKILLEYANLFLPNEDENNPKVILNLFPINFKKVKNEKKCIALFLVNRGNSKVLKCYTFLKNY